MLDATTRVESFEAASRDESVIVRVGRSGNTLAVQLEAPALDLTDDELANRIVRLNTLAYLRSQLALRQEMAANHVEGILPQLPTEQQVRQYQQTIDF
ncbi:DUF2694 family protein [Mycobacteroides abscessus subsp. abscessus]|uniref:DUF2694 family protein n=1 Tax=Mycolicibacterium farcinogenes TaxID=1802 RepID=A0ACD1FQZ8_MYCFR|nr:MULTISPECIES: DUF2694 family protein [Mycolicibacterium]MDO3240979.1 DUF2694 family protein [Mycobacteroides abscessus subsp. abscessus]QZH69489.1 DUF2694 family protein [Mycolicibacterium farcinogenes]